MKKESKFEEGEMIKKRECPGGRAPKGLSMRRGSGIKREGSSNGKRKELERESASEERGELSRGWEGRGNVLEPAREKAFKKKGGRHLGGGLEGMGSLKGKISKGVLL